MMLRCVKDRGKSEWLKVGSCWKSSSALGGDGQKQMAGRDGMSQQGMRVGEERSNGIDAVTNTKGSLVHKNTVYRFKTFGRDWKIQVGNSSSKQGGAWATVTCGGTVVQAVAALIRSEPFVSRKGSRRGGTGALGDGYENDAVCVEFKERYFSAGKLPPHFHKKESGGRRDAEVLASARIQKALMSAVKTQGCVQVKLNVLSADPTCDPEIVAMNAGSVALSLASDDVVWTGPIAAVRLVRSHAQGGDFETTMNAINYSSSSSSLPSPSSGSSVQSQEGQVVENKEAYGDIVVAGTGQGVVYVQGAFDASIASKDVMKGIEKGFKEICESGMLENQILCAKGVADGLQETHDARRVVLVPGADAVAARRIYTDLYSKIEDQVLHAYIRNNDYYYSEDRTISLNECMESVKEDMIVQLQNEGRWRSEAARIRGSGCVTRSDIDYLCGSILKRLLYKNLLETGKGITGKKYDDITPCMVETGVLPMAHGSSSVSSGNMCVIGAATCGGQDEQLHNEYTLFGEVKKRVSVGYSQTIATGSGSYSTVSLQKKEADSVNFLENAIRPILPSPIENPFSFRVNIDVLNADGSEPSYSVCAAYAALKDLTLNLQTEDCTSSTVCLLSENADTYGGEEFEITLDELTNATKNEELGSYVLLGEPSEMESICSDAKLVAAGTDAGKVTACSLSVVQPGGLHIKALRDMFELSDMLRMKRSKSMMRSFVHGKKKRAQFSKFGDMAIPKSTLSKVIGKDGQVLRHIEEQNRGKVSIDSEGNCKLFAPTPEEYRALQEALMLAAGSRLIPGRSYRGHITAIKDFGAFVKLPESNIDALLHISEISHEKIKAVEDVLQEGQEIQVQFLGRDQVGSLRVSRKAVLGDPKSATLDKNE